MEIKWLTIFICSLLLAAVARAAQGQSNENGIPKWRYDRIPDKMTGNDVLAASIEGLDGMYLAIERHPEGVTTAYGYFLDDSGKLFFCGLRGAKN